jgi:NB-ARC domain
MIKETLIAEIISHVTSLAKGKLDTRKTKQEIEKAVHAAFTELANDLLPLTFDGKFSKNLFKLAKNQTVDAVKLVDLAVKVSEGGELGLSRSEVIELLKKYALKLINIFEEIAPKSGDIPNAPNNFYQSLDRQDIFGEPSDQAAKTTPHNIPPSSNPKTFLGRDEALKRLHEKLQQSKEVAITAVQGMGGIGKTELANKYARSSLEVYPGGIIWVNARAEDVSSQIFVPCQRWFRMRFPDEMDPAERVASCWANWPTEGDVLVVFDDVFDYTLIESNLPLQPSRFKVLITTRRNLNIADTFSIDVLDKSASLELLIEWIGQERVHRENESAKELCFNLG